MKKRETQAQRAVSFSKRRYGLFNKAAELCMLSGSQVGVIVSSPTSRQNVYCFGPPSVEAVFDAFLNNRDPQAVDAGTVDSAICLYNAVKDLEGELEKRRGKKGGDGVGKGLEFDDWFEVVLGRSESVSELQVVVEEMEKLKENAVKRLNELLDSAKVEDDGDLGAVSDCHGMEVKDKSIVVSGGDHYSYCSTHQDVKQDAFSFGNSTSAMVPHGQDAFWLGNSLMTVPAPDECYSINTQVHETMSAATTTAANPLDEPMPITTVNEWDQLPSYDDDPLFYLRKIGIINYD